MHYDFAKDEKQYNADANKNVGNRIATVLFYLSQPELGGATVFPILNLTLLPIKIQIIFRPIICFRIMLCSGIIYIKMTLHLHELCMRGILFY